ncbi:sodium/bile acid cotransporter 4 isoform X2 [Gopherus evgoodei]|uniref:sodium/bile acid cotransporter 4 isoform X2 n=1 Tax=Gopherus evgoodei TaxID=1825980 RepID=UPI0011CF6EA1|nr:sodium/bile acid cotransporter 4 isoform X2 [Gopherus evgoodei]
MRRAQPVLNTCNYYLFVLHGPLRQAGFTCKNIIFLSQKTQLAIPSTPLNHIQANIRASPACSVTGEKFLQSNSYLRPGRLLSQLLERVLHDRFVPRYTKWICTASSYWRLGRYCSPPPHPAADGRAARADPLPVVLSPPSCSIIMTASSTLLALLLMPLCLWIYSRAWINTPLVQLLPLGAVSLTLCSTLLPIGVGVLIRYKYTRVADLLLKVSLWSLLVTLVLLFILTGTMLGPELLASIPASVYIVALLMPLAGYASGYGLATLFHLPPHCKRTVSLETGCQNVQLCTAILKLTFPPHLIGSMYMFPLLYALFQAAEAGIFVLVYKMYGRDAYKQDPLNEDEDTDISYKKLKEEEMADTSYGTVTTEEHNSILMEPAQTAL